MKTFLIITLFAAWMSLAAVVSLAITMDSWGAHIEGKAFHCTEEGFDMYWTDIDSHRGAGDTLAPGWTWEKLKVVRLHYIEVFWLIWAVISVIPFLFCVFHKQRPNQ